MKTSLSLLLAVGIAFAISLGACSSPNEPSITPPQPSFTDSTVPPNPVDGRIYADIDPSKDAINIDWNQDTTNNTTGYHLYRSLDSTVDNDGLLANRDTIATLETSNYLINPLPTSFRDTTSIFTGRRYWYQLQAYYRSPNGTITNSKPTQVDLTTSFRYLSRVIPERPFGNIQVTRDPVIFEWKDPQDGGLFQIIVKTVDGVVIWSQVFNDYETDIQESYPLTSPPLVSGGQYQWRVKKLDLYGGSSSPWISFSVQ